MKLIRLTSPFKHATDVWVSPRHIVRVALDYAPVSGYFTTREDQPQGSLPCSRVFLTDGTSLLDKRDPSTFCWALDQHTEPAPSDGAY